MYIGMDRFAVREQIAKDLAEAGLIEKVENYENKVGYSERNADTVAEPRLSNQWFLRMEELARPAVGAVDSDTIRFIPEKFKNTFDHWMAEIHDWCISRQLWWGHRIPAWYLPDGTFVVAMDTDEALELARKNDPSLTAADLRQEEDGLDTWFSSWLWPITLFNGILDPDNEEMRYYYPTTDLVTGPDIIFFWVARMIMAGYGFAGKEPFRNVYFTGIVRDEIGRKMSKQLGNSPDALKLIADYGADGVRVGIMLCAPAGNDILFDTKLCETGRSRTARGRTLRRGMDEGASGTVDRGDRRPLQQVPHLRGPARGLPPLLGRLLVVVSRNGQARIRLTIGSDHLQ